MEALANCRCQVLVGDKNGALRSYWRAYRVVFVRSTLVSKLIMLAEALIRPRSHISNECICCSRCSMEALANCSCQAFNGLNSHCFRIVGPDQG